MWDALRKILPAGEDKGNQKPLARILVIDDDETTCTLIKSVLSRRGFEVHTAADGMSGFETAKNIKPDVIFLDCLMPGVPGIEIGKKLKSDPLTKDIPVIMLTAVDTPKNIIDCYDFGADNYLVKPVGPRELLNLVESSLKDYELS